MHIRKINNVEKKFFMNYVPAADADFSFNFIAVIKIKFIQGNYYLYKCHRVTLVRKAIVIVPTERTEVALEVPIMTRMAAD